MSSRCAWIRWVVSLLLTCTLLGRSQAAPGGAGASDDPCIKDTSCREHYQRAIGLYESGRYEAALPEFQSAYESRQVPWLLINIGRTLHRLGRLDEAITFYNRYEQAAINDDPETVKKVREYKAQAEVLLSAKGAAAAANPDPSVGTPDPAAAKPPDLTAKPPVPAPPKDQQPVYKKWWFWTAIGGGVAVIAIIGIAAGVSANSRAPIPDDAVVYTPTF